MNAEETIAVLRAELAVAQDTIAALTEQVATLLERVTGLEGQRATDRHNSSKPPSSDGPARIPRSLRGTSGKKPGGQPGHRGAHPRLVDTPDHIVVRRPLVCPACAAPLAAEEVDGVERRQVVAAPPVRARVTAYQGLRVRCPHGQTAVTGAFPAAVAAQAQDGPRLRALTVYLTHQQLLPYGRTRAVLRDLLGCAVSHGLVAAMAREAAERLAPVEEVIADALRAGALLHNDETGLAVQGKRGWLHTASTARLTPYGVHPKRGAAATDAIGILPGVSGTSVHDGWAPYRQYACRHALRTAHHLRELAWVEEQDGQAWAGALATLLRQINQTVKAVRDRGQAALSARTRRRFRQRYTRLLADGLAANPPPPDAGPPRRGRPTQSKAKNVLDRLRHADEVLAFMDDVAIPFDNNQAEQDVRMVKVQQKVSGAFRREMGAQTFARLRGYLSTLRKQGLPALAALESVFHGHPLVPSLTS